MIDITYSIRPIMKRCKFELKLNQYESILTVENTSLWSK